MPKLERIALIGAGAFSEFCLDSYRKHLPQVNVVAIFDQNTQVAKAFGVKHGIGVVAANIHDLLAVDCEAVIILTPPNTHYELGKLALEADKNVLIEKPIAFTTDQADELVHLANRKGLRFTANLVLRHHPFHLQLRQAVQDRPYGKLLEIKTTARLAEYPADHWYWNKEISGGFFLNTYTHFFDLYHFVYGEKVTSAGHRGNTDNGELIQLKFQSTRATLDINLHATNADELVETEYLFEQATVKVAGWLPEKLTILTEGKTTTTTDELAKIDRYQKCLAGILDDLLHPSSHALIQPADLAEAVRVSLLCQTTILS